VDFVRRSLSTIIFGRGKHLSTYERNQQ